MKHRIEYWGYEAITASNGEDAIRAFKDKGPDAIILDYVMPDINGIDLLKKIRGINKKIPVIMFTAKPEFEAIRNSEKLNISAFIPKLSPLVDTQASLKKVLYMVFKKKGD
ncbi:MAG: response regulator [Candidatus Omnitrophica bacterium]|nr:response regulator [Candidatus Omnitrophota bacterium]